MPPPLRAPFLDRSARLLAALRSPACSSEESSLVVRGADPAPSRCVSSSAMADKPPPAPPKGAAAAATGAQPSKRRDALLALEAKVQAEWEAKATFSADAADDGRPKFFVTFPCAVRVPRRPCSISRARASDARRDFGDERRICLGTRPRPDEPSREHAVALPASRGLRPPSDAVAPLERSNRDRRAAGASRERASPPQVPVHERAAAPESRLLADQGGVRGVVQAAPGLQRALPVRVPLHGHADPGGGEQVEGRDRRVREPARLPRGRRGGGGRRGQGRRGGEEGRRPREGDGRAREEGQGEEGQGPVQERGDVLPVAVPGEDGHRGGGDRGLRGALQVARLLPALRRRGPQALRDVDRLAAVVHHDGQEPVLRLLRAVAVPEAQGRGEDGLREAGERLRRQGQAVLRGPRPRDGRGRRPAGVHADQAQGRGPAALPRKMRGVRRLPRAGDAAAGDHVRPDELLRPARGRLRRVPPGGRLGLRHVGARRGRHGPPGVLHEERRRARRLPRLREDLGRRRPRGGGRPSRAATSWAAP